MRDLAAKPRQRNDATPAKNRVGVCGSKPNKHTYRIDPQALQPRRVKPPTATKLASGRLVWLSQDPIGETGGVNLYGYVGSDPVNGWDPLGLVELNLFPEGDDVLHPGADLTDTNFYDVASHAEPNRFLYHGDWHSASDLADLMIQSGYDGKKDVLLIACRAGVKGDDGSTLGKKLQRELRSKLKNQDITVWAPTSYVWLNNVTGFTGVFGKDPNDPSKKNLKDAGRFVDGNSNIERCNFDQDQVSKSMTAISNFLNRAIFRH